MTWYSRLRSAINAAAPFLASTQKTNLALLVSAVLKKQTLCLSDLDRAYPTLVRRHVVFPKHCLLHRLERLWRFTDNKLIDAPPTRPTTLLLATIGRLRAVGGYVSGRDRLTRTLLHGTLDGPQAPCESRQEFLTTLNADPRCR